MKTEPRGSQAESPLSIVASASRTTAADLATIERESTGILVDAVGLVAAGLRLADGGGAHGDGTPRHLAAERLWHADPARRRERAELLRAIADLLDTDTPPTDADLIAAMPHGWVVRVIELSSADVLRRRVSATEAHEGLTREQFRKRNAALVGSVHPGRFSRLLSTIKAVAFTAFGSKH